MYFLQQVWMNCFALVRGIKSSSQELRSNIWANFFHIFARAIWWSLLCVACRCESSWCSGQRISHRGVEFECWEGCCSGRQQQQQQRRSVHGNCQRSAAITHTDGLTAAAASHHSLWRHGSTGVAWPKATWHDPECGRADCCRWWWSSGRRGTAITDAEDVRRGRIVDVDAAWWTATSPATAWTQCPIRFVVCHVSIARSDGCWRQRSYWWHPVVSPATLRSRCQQSTGAQCSTEVQIASDVPRRWPSLLFATDCPPRRRLSVSDPVRRSRRAPRGRVFLRATALLVAAAAASDVVVDVVADVTEWTVQQWRHGIGGTATSLLRRQRRSDDVQQRGQEAGSQNFAGVCSDVDNGFLSTL